MLNTFCDISYLYLFLLWKLFIDLQPIFTIGVLWRVIDMVWFHSSTCGHLVFQHICWRYCLFSSVYFWHLFYFLHDLQTCFILLTPGWFCCCGSILGLRWGQRRRDQVVCYRNGAETGALDLEDRRRAEDLPAFLARVSYGFPNNGCWRWGLS